MLFEYCEKFDGKDVKSHTQTHTHTRPPPPPSPSPPHQNLFIPSGVSKLYEKPTSTPISFSQVRGLHRFTTELC